MFQNSRSFLGDAMTTFARKCAKFIVVSCHSRPPRSPFFTDDKAIELMLESRSTVDDAGSIVRIIEQSVKSYD
jgi:hypothetical protein